MPFTFSHPAVFVPLVRGLKNKVSVTGLVVGSMMPDLEYFVRMQAKSLYGHRLDGVIWFDLPLGLLIAFFFHNVIRNAVIEHLPSPIQQRLWPSLSFNWNLFFKKHWPVVVVSLVAGSLSHLGWDWATHAGAFKLREVIEGYVPVDDGEDFLIYYLFFGLNSLAGLWVLLRYLKRLPCRSQKMNAAPPFPYWSVAVLWAAVFLFVRIVTADDLGWLGYVDSSLTALMTGVIVATFCKKLFVRRLARG